MKLEQGELNIVYLLLEKLLTIADIYDYTFARALQLARETTLFIQCGKMYDAQKTVEKFELYAVKMGAESYLLLSHGYRAQIYNMLKDFDEAEKSLNQAEQYYKTY